MPFRTTFLITVGGFTLAGCGAPPDAPPANGPELPVAEAPRDDPKSEPVPPHAVPPPTPIEPPVLPTDLAGRVVTKALMPDVSGGPTPPTRTTARPRSTDLDRGELPLPTVVVAASRSPLPATRSPLPSPPVERSPIGLGNAAALGVAAFPLPERPLLKAPGPVNPGATDVPAMACQLPDRAAVTDPTVELSAKGVIETPFPLPAEPLPYRKADIPNPFVFAEQLKGNLGRETELGTAPTVVPPERK